MVFSKDALNSCQSGPFLINAASATGITAHVSRQATQTPDAASTGKIPCGYTIAAINSAIHNIRNSPLITFFFISVCSL